MRNHPHHCSGYRVIHWNPNLAQNSIHLQPSSITTIIRILAVIYFTARAVRLDEESSKLLILAPHNDTIDDLEGKLGAPAPNYPPTLFDFYLVCIYRRYYLPTNCDKFQYTNSQGNTVTPVPQGVSTADIHRYITGNEALKEDLQSRASISLIVELATSYPRGFATYCTVSNTVRAIGIGGTASLFLSALARFTSPTAMASHHRAWQRLRHIGAPACPRYQGTSQPTPTTHSPLAAPPFRCTCLAPLPQLSDSIIREHIWRLHHIGAPASPFFLFDLIWHHVCHATYQRA